ncbi:hypothetical protein V3851_08930 [Paenibacillus sp. M1]|uniref:DUF2642 domain-containing protein n=1 Tax=Paenibacillus haidiansis TaxID=1574488 RepID=A0ABU7VQE3_9BACL
MNFEERLSAFIGRMVEAVSTNQFLDGRLLRTGNRQFTIQVDSTSYIPQPREVTVFTDNIAYVRIPPQ